MTLKIFLPEGSPEGLRIVERAGWVGTGLDFARSDWPKVRGRPDFERPGVYLLSGPNDSGQTAIYVGEADDLRARLTQHFTGKDFWTRGTVFVSKDDFLNKAHVRYLESRLIQLAVDARRAKVENGNAPAPPPLSESDRAEAESFLEEMLVIFPLLRVDAFDRPSTITPSAQQRLFLNAKGISARGREASEGFIVEAGATAVASEVPSIQPWMSGQRSRLIGSNVLVANGPVLKLAKDWVFGSPSAAAGVLLGRSANGRTEWKDESGRSLKEIQIAAVKKATS